jgi:hypothetical protein
MKYRRNPQRRDRASEPHVRIPDSIYGALASFGPYELKLWIALKSKEWRKDGTRKGLVKKSLNRIARDIGMSRYQVQTSFKKLKGMGLVEWSGFGIRLLELDFTTAFTTPITTSVHRRGRPTTRPGVASLCASDGRQRRPGATVIPFESNEFGCGRSVLTIRSSRGAPSAPGTTVDVPGVPAYHASRESARASARSSGALPASAHSKRKSEASAGEKPSPAPAPDERPLSREEARKYLESVFARADQANASRALERDREREKHEARKRELLQQAAELAAAEKPERRNEE